MINPVPRTSQTRLWERNKFYKLSYYQPLWTGGFRSNIKGQLQIVKTLLETYIKFINSPKCLSITLYLTKIHILSGRWAISAGWGMVSYLRKVYSPDLVSLWTTIMDNHNTECDKRFGDRIKSTNICCAGGTGRQSPVNICEGDFGGPLILRKEKMLIGIASFTTTNCALGEPNVFTNIMKYTYWIAGNSDIKFDTWWQMVLSDICDVNILKIKSKLSILLFNLK